MARLLIISPGVNTAESIVLVLIIRVGVERVAGVEKEVAQTHRGLGITHRSTLPTGEVFEVGGLVAKDTEERLAPGVVAAQGVLGGPAPFA